MQQDNARKCLRTTLLALAATWTNAAHAHAPFSGAYTLTTYKNPGHVLQGSACITFTPAKVGKGFPNAGKIVIGDVPGGEYVVTGGTLFFFTNDGITVQSSGGEYALHATTTNYQVPLSGAPLKGSYVMTTATTSTVSSINGIVPDVVGSMTMEQGC